MGNVPWNCISPLDLIQMPKSGTSLWDSYGLEAGRCELLEAHVPSCFLIFPITEISLSCSAL